MKPCGIIMKVECERYLLNGHIDFEQDYIQHNTLFYVPMW